MRATVVREEVPAMTQAKLAAASAVPAAGEGARLWLEASRAVFGGFAASQAELTGFWRDRLERWREMTEAVAACRGPDDVLRVHAEYAREMLEAYAAVWLRVVAPVIERPAGAAT